MRSMPISKILSIALDTQKYIFLNRRLQKRKTLFIEDLLLRGGPSGSKSWVSGFWKPKPITNKTQTNLNIIQYM